MSHVPPNVRIRHRLVALAVALVSIAGVGSALAPTPAGAGVPDHCVSDAQSFVCLSYLSFLRRAGSTEDVAYWAPQMPARRTFFLATLGRTVESRRRMIEGYYFRFADDEPDPAGLAYWEGEVLKLNGFRRLEAALLGAYVGTIDGYLDRAFPAVLGRDASPAERTYWGTRVAQTSRNLVAADLAFTTEARRTRVRWTYQNELGYFPDDLSRDYWAQRLRTGTSYLDLRIAIKASPDGYPDGSEYCSSLSPPTGYVCP